MGADTKCLLWLDLLDFKKREMFMKYDKTGNGLKVCHCQCSLPAAGSTYANVKVNAEKGRMFCALVDQSILSLLLNGLER